MLFTYEAFNRNGAIVTGEVDAEDERGVVLYLETKDLIPSKIRPKGEKGGILDLKFLQKIRLFERVKTTDIIFLVRNLATAIKAGLSISEALEILINDSKPGTLRYVLISAKATVQAGRPLSDAFEQYKKIFPSVFIGLIKAGEVSSRLDKALEELSNHLVKEYNLVRKIRSAMVYPALLLVATIGVTVFLLTVVLPKLTKAFQQSNASLPLITKILLATGTFMAHNFIILSIITTALIGGFIYMASTERGKLYIEKILLKIPVVNELMKRVDLVRFTRTLGSLLASAMPVLDALQISADAIGSYTYRAALKDVIDKVKSGVPLSKSLQFHKDLFPTLLTSLISVGERTGNLEYVLTTFSDFYDEEVDNKLKDLTTLFEPIMLLVMGVIVGGVALSILLPIYSLVSQFT